MVAACRQRKTAFRHFDSGFHAAKMRLDSALVHKWKRLARAPTPKEMAM